MRYVYLLLLSNGDIYKGSTESVSRRLKEHTDGKVEATKHFRPHQLIGFEAYTLDSDAWRRERFLKTPEGRRFLRQQYRDALNKNNKQGKL